MEKTTYGNAHEKEAAFDINELFFSITTLDSTILSGNEVFVRISGYTREEVIGRYHNIVRHPDMPRILFKVIWDFIKESKPIAGYVKNRTKTGEYYWVFAALFPLEDRYISIRIKPTSRFFAVAQEIYPKLLNAEKSGGMEESEAMISPLLHSIGYDNYDQFMSDALLHEVQGRKGLIAPRVASVHTGEPVSVLSKHLRSVHTYTETLMKIYDEWFDKIDTFIQVKSAFKEKSLVLRQLAREVVFLSLNASVASYKVANGGDTFAILARDVRTNAKENDDLITRIDELSQEITGNLNSLIFSCSGIRLQSEILTYFIKELLCEDCNVEHHEIEENIDTLITLVSEYAKKTDLIQLQIKQQMGEVLKNLDQLEQQMMYLGYIQVYGIIEAAGNRNETVSFEGIFSQLKLLIQTTSHEIEAMGEMGNQFYNENHSLLEKFDGVKSVLNGLNEEIECIKKVS